MTDNPQTIKIEIAVALVAIAALVILKIELPDNSNDTAHHNVSTIENPVYNPDTTAYAETAAYANSDNHARNIRQNSNTTPAGKDAPEWSLELMNYQNGRVVKIYTLRKQHPYSAAELPGTAPSAASRFYTMYRHRDMTKGGNHESV